MRQLTAAAGAALFALLAAPAFAGDRPGGGSPCCGHRPPPPPCCHSGSANINVNVNASARASAAASARSWLNARAYDPGGMRSGRAGGGIVYVGGGYADEYGYVGGRVFHGPVETFGRPCPSAPFGYVATGFGRDDFRPSPCGYREEVGYDRGGRYGYSERRASAARESYEVYESREPYEAWEEGYVVDGRGARDCDCYGDRPPAPYPPPYLPEPPRYEPPRPERSRSHRPERPRRTHPPRQTYRQEPGERG